MERRGTDRVWVAPSEGRMPPTRMQTTCSQTEASFYTPCADNNVEQRASDGMRVHDSKKCGRASLRLPDMQSQQCLLGGEGDQEAWQGIAEPPRGWFCSEQSWTVFVCCCALCSKGSGTCVRYRDEPSGN